LAVTTKVPRIRSNPAQANAYKPDYLNVGVPDSFKTALQKCGITQTLIDGSWPGVNRHVIP
jgi:hypothetical protein